MNIVKAKLIKHDTDDGLMGIQNEIPLGKIYFVDKDTIETFTAWNKEKNIFHDKEMVIDTETKEYLPTEVLEIE